MSDRGSVNNGHGQNTRFRRHRIWIFCLGITVVVAAGVWIAQARHVQHLDEAAAAAASALQQNRFDEARRLAGEVLSYRADDSATLLVAARAAVAKADWEDAYELRDRMSPFEQRSAARRLFSKGESSVNAGYARKAENCLRLATILDPNHLDAKFILAFILGAEGRAWEAAPLVRTLIEQNRYGIPQLLLVGGTDEFFINQRLFVDRCLQAVPNDPLPLLASARDAIVNEDPAMALQILEKVLNRVPEQVEALARKGRLLLENHDFDLLRKWQAGLPPEADEHPEIWITRGLYAMEHDQQQAAIHCFAEAARLDPNSRVANLRLAQLLLASGQDSLAEKFSTRAEKLAKLLVLLTSLRTSPDLSLMRRVAELCESLGRPREALVWTEFVLRSQPNSLQLRDTALRLRHQYSGNIPWILVEAQLGNQIDTDQLPLPDWNVSADQLNAAATVSEPTESDIQFEEDAATVGIRFQFHNDAELPDRPQRMIEFSGGGIGVIDFDGNGWPDLYAAQGCPFPVRNGQDSPVDRLFRNRGDGHFDDVTDGCGISEASYSQGVTVGDFNQDGFPDIYVGNIGRNRLFKNNGDGTFQDVTDRAALHDQDWTTSCFVADLNGDALPEIFAVNYLKGPGVYSRICGTPSHPSACLPAQFAPQQDRLWVNTGVGQFKEPKEQGLVPEKSSGRGLGVLVTPIDDPGRPNIMIANDTDPNFWYVNQTEESGGQPSLSEQAMSTGLALDADGRPQAGMGIGLADVNRDGRLDALVTNFHRESNTLYVQQPGGLFLDQTKDAKLRTPSLPMLGFGAQFLDADADGWVDLVVANGHVFNNSHLGEPWKMPPQIFRNNSQGRFVEIEDGQAGACFERQILGRGLVRWDWNRDGLPDVAMSHLDVPLAVMTNRSESAFHSLVLNLRGVTSNREAIGTLIHVTAGTDRWTTAITAGDGYLSSNQRQIILGIGQHRLADRIEIHWPSGSRQEINNLASGHEFSVVEGRTPVLVHW